MIGEWRAHIVEDFPLGLGRIQLGRILGDAVEILVGFTETGSPVFARQPPEVVTEVRALPALPMEAIRAIAAAVRPGPSEAEMALVREALKVERARVDRVLDAHLAAGGH